MTLRVCMVTRHSCIRVFKQGYALSQLDGVTVDLITMMQTFGFNLFNSMMVYSDRDMLRRSVAHAAHTADVFHVHNEPDWLVSDVRAATDKPIVYDAHDLESLRWQREPDEDEANAFGLSDAWVHVSDPCRIAAERYHGNTKPHLTLSSYVNELFIGPEPAGEVSWNSIVYEGGLSSADTFKAHTGEEVTNFRNYLQVVKAFREQGYNVSLFSTGQVEGNKYQQLGAVVVSGMSYLSMLNALRPFAFGLVGSAKEFPLMNAAMPNKLFEYISQGVVPVCYHADHAADWCEEHGVGIRLDGLDNLREQLAGGPAIRETILAKRKLWTMEGQIGQLVDLYREII